MTTFALRLKTARLDKGLSQSELADKAGVSQSLITKIESGNAQESRKASKLAAVLGVDTDWLVTGKEPNPNLTRSERPSVESNAVYLGGFDLWDEDTPLDDDEVALPFFREVKLSAGSGSITQVIENHGFKLRFAKSTLRKASVQPDHAHCVTVDGGSMEPVLPHGCTIGVNTLDTTIQDGKVYAIDQNGELRVKLLYKLPGGGIRVRSYNRDEYPDETITGTDLEGFKILGRMFWSSVLW